MIDRIIIENFKSLRRVDLLLGRLNLFIGTNASGKSNFLDALRILQGIGNGFTISEILDGKPRSATSDVWGGIRGGSLNARFSGAADTESVTIEAHGTLEQSGKQWMFKIRFLPNFGRVLSERLDVGGTIYDSTDVKGSSRRYPTIRVRYYPGTGGRPPELTFESSRPVLGQFFDHPDVKNKLDTELARVVVGLLANAQQVDPSPPVLQRYSLSHRVERLGDRGENFAALVQTICQDEKVKSAYLSWLQELRPDEVDDVGTLSGAVGEPLFMLREKGQTFPAPVLSDGTLRFAAITAAFFQPEMPQVMTIEEIENGIHPSRLRLLVELLVSQSKSGKTQIFATTHSPTTLAWLQEAEYRTTFVCKRDEETGESTIRPLTDVPHFPDVSAKYPLSDLFAEGWLEAAL